MCPSLPFAGRILLPRLRPIHHGDLRLDGKEGLHARLPSAQLSPMLCTAFLGRCDGIRLADKARRETEAIPNKKVKGRRPPSALDA